MIRARELDEARERDRREREARATSLSTLQGDFQSKAEGLVSSPSNTARRVEETAKNLNTIADTANERSVSAARDAERSTAGVHDVAEAAERPTGTGLGNSRPRGRGRARHPIRRGRRAECRPNRRGPGDERHARRRGGDVDPRHRRTDHLRRSTSRSRPRARARRARASPRRIGGISADIATDVVRRLTDVGAIAANVREAADGAGAVARSAAGIGEAARRGLGSPGEVARMTTELAGVVDSFLAGARARRNEETGREASRRVATD